jgi:glycosyltransferase involved in cell wall biosynthesis
MKLLFVIVNLEKGGAQRVMLNLCHSLKHHHEIEIIALRASEIGYPLDNLEFRVLDNSRSKNRFIRFLDYRIQIKEVLKNRDFDGIISFLPEPNFLICSIKTQVFKIINVRNDPTIEYRGIFNPIMRYFYPKADHCVVQTETIKQFFKPFISTISVIPNPVSEISVYDIERKPIILNAGRLVAQKNQKNLIKAFKIVNESYPDFECHIYGEGRLAEELGSMIDSYGLKDKVRIFNPVDSIFMRMQEAQIFVLSSDYEGYPNVLLEAMVCGCAVISTDCASKGPASIIQNNQNGLLVPVNDEIALSNAIIQCMNEQTRLRLSENAKQIKISHSNSKFLKSYKLIIESLGDLYVKS